jgi:hypothetical protein
MTGDDQVQDQVDLTITATCPGQGRVATKLPEQVSVLAIDQVDQVVTSSRQEDPNQVIAWHHKLLAVREGLIDPGLIRLEQPNQQDDSTTKAPEINPDFKIKTNQPLADQPAKAGSIIASPLPASAINPGAGFLQVVARKRPINPEKVVLWARLNL